MKTVKKILPVLFSFIALIFVVVLFPLSMRARYNRYTKNSAISSTNKFDIPEIKKCAFVINPIKKDVRKAVEQIKKYFEEHDLGTPLFYQTEKDSPGFKQAGQAIKDGCDTVIAVGGDGTARNVAGGLAGTDTKFSVIPIGTGNVFSHAIFMPQNEVVKCLDIIFSGMSTYIDMGWLNLSGKQDEDLAEPFLVIAGAGFDAEMSASVTEKSKRRFKVIAYFIACTKHILYKSVGANITIHDTDKSQRLTGNVKSIMLANSWNYGILNLLPHSKIDDSSLDVSIINTGNNFCAWIFLATRIILHGFGFDHFCKTESDVIPEDKLVLEMQKSARVVIAEFNKKVKMEVDGDYIGESDILYGWVTPKCLNIILPNDVLDK